MLQSGQPVPQVAFDPRSEAFVEKFANALLDKGLLDALTLRRAKRAQAQSRERFDLVLTRLGLVTEEPLLQALSEFLAIPVIGVNELPPSPLLAEELPFSFLKSSRIIPVACTADTLVLATADPFNTEALASVAFLLNREVQCRLIAAGDLEQALERLYQTRNPAAPRADISAPGGGGDDVAVDDIRRLEDLASEAPVIKLVNELIVRAVEAQASDIHIEPSADSVRVRFRVDGVLHTVETLPPAVRPALSSRVKVMAHLNIAERRLPQDGRTKMTVRGREIDLRVSSMPTMHGESVVLRILDRTSVALDFDSLGFTGKAAAAFERLLLEPNGIILVTGPTGSGKTTTLYAALSRLNQPASKLFTVEDPIEYQLAGVNQIQVNARIGLTFASALRSMLRQDPDIIMVGEIRDLETAEIAVRASLTGHLVLSTVHTNSAAATITRLLDMGVEDYLLASSLKGVLAQRLVRRLCPHCSRPAELPDSMTARLEKLRDPDARQVKDIAAFSGIRRPVGCPSCRNTGYMGRTAIYELIAMSPVVREAMFAGAGEKEIEKAAAAEGTISMLANGLEKVLAGETTLEEVLRVTGGDDGTL